MGWIESPPYFCAASETGQDMAQQHMERKIGSISDHKFVSLAAQGDDFDNLSNYWAENRLSYLLEVFVDDYIALAIPTC